MDTEQAVQSTIEVLQEMSDNPQAVLEVLDSAERVNVMTELSVIADHSTGVENEADLRNLTDAVTRLVEGTPALSAFVSSHEERVRASQDRPTTRKVSFGYHNSRSSGASRSDTGRNHDDWHAQAHATLISNHVFNVRRKLERALQERPEEHPRNDGDD